MRAKEKAEFVGNRLYSKFFRGVRKFFSKYGCKTQVFHEKLSRFYETGDANDMMAFFQKETGAMYPPKEKLPEFV